jgi:hypothetical protein
METDANHGIVELQVTYDRNDFARFLISHYCGRPVYRVMRATTVLCAILLALVGLVVTEDAGRVVCFALAAFFASYLTVLLPWSLRRAAYASYATDLAMQQPTNFRFSSDGVGVANALVSGSFLWQAYWKAAETRHGFLVFLANNRAHILPKRCFASSEDMERFREIVRAALGEKAKGIRG